MATSGATQTSIFDRIVCGIDGTAESLFAARQANRLQSDLAVAAARSVASSCRAELRMVSATRDQVDRDAARRIAPELEERDGPALGVLVSESEQADLVVVGSRGLRGLKTFGSVSERIAHQASCSVLIVRVAAHG